MSMRPLCMLVPLMSAAAALLGGEVDQAVKRDVLEAEPKIVQAWQEMRFGMFVCWGPVSLTGREIGWSRGAPRGGEFRVRKGQVRELLTRYGRIDGFWFDLGGKPEDWDSVKLFTMMRKLQPWLIINNRCGLPGDFDTPEQRLGPFQLERPWETCMTLGTQWSWKPNDRIKSLKECVDVLVTCAGRNGNLALNTGPMPDGRIEPRQAERFQQIGSWLKRYGESIYGTRGGPYWGVSCVSTRKGNTIYVHVLKWPEERLVLPAIPRKIVSHTLLTEGTATLRQSEQGIEIDVPVEQRRDLDTIVVLNLDGPAGGVEPLRVAWGR